MAIDYGAGGNRSRAYDRHAQALQMKLNAENQQRARDIDREGLFGTGIKTKHIKGIGDSLMSAYKIAHAAKKEKLTALKDQHKSEMDALYKGIDSLPETGEGAKQRAALGLRAIKAQENFNNQYQQFSDKSVTEFTRGGRESMVLNRLPKQTKDELETALSGESGAKVDGIMNQSQEDIEAAKTLHGTDKAGVATGTYVPPKIPIGIDPDEKFLPDASFGDFQKNNQQLSLREQTKQKNMQARQSREEQLIPKGFLADYNAYTANPGTMDDRWQYGDQPPNERQRPPWNPYSWERS